MEGEKSVFWRRRGSGRQRLRSVIEVDLHGAEEVGEVEWRREIVSKTGRNSGVL